ncbi:MAG: 4Fe-4S dicluster domain-containing protein [Acidimicrobiia bacterium]|nr:4Fe-4S dicluster domain-containing protein [Acidimicrobiia bacterium]
MDLRLDEDLLAGCVSCGLCLPHCPTFRVTGEERYSPRGRIEAMRQVHLGGWEADSSFLDIVDTCVQCRGCETACPSGVQFGRLMEATRETLAEETSYQPAWRSLPLRVLGHHRLLLAGSTVLAFAQRLRLVPSARLGLPARLPLRRARLRQSGNDVWLFTGCVMDAWQRDVHAAVKRVLEAAGAGVAIAGPGAACCGALHSHAGLGGDARALARRTMEAFPGEAPVLVDAAGCGAEMKDYGHLLGTPEAEAFAARVRDVHEWLAERLDRLPEARPGPRPTVAVQDPCHLRHVQRAHLPVRAVLGRYADLVELDDEGLCCGAGGAYAVFQRDLALDIRARKVGAIERAGAPVVASANPGCQLHLAAAGVAARHPLELVDEAIRG